MFDENIHPQKKEGLRQKNLEDGCVIQNQDKKELYTLNLTATYIWELCDGMHSIKQIIDELTDIGNAKREAIKNDVQAIITDFVQKELLYNLGQ